MIKIVSYNIRYSLKIDDAIALIQNSPALSNADVICLQEMVPGGVEKIAKALQYKFIYHAATYHSKIKEDFGNAVLSKWPILDHSKIVLPKLGLAKMRRIAVRARLRIQDEDITVVCVHLSILATAAERKILIRLILDSIPSSTQYCVIAGDFNTFTQKSTETIVSAFKEGGYHLATRQLNFSYRHWYLFNKKSVLDHIFCKGFNIVSTGKVSDFSPSDHLPIWAELQFDK